jgi:hypothetical protein
MGPCILAKGYLLVDAENIFLQAITKFPNWGGASISAVTVFVFQRYQTIFGCTVRHLYSIYHSSALHPEKEA